MGYLSSFGTKIDCQVCFHHTRVKYGYCSKSDICFSLVKRWDIRSLWDFVDPFVSYFGDICIRYHIYIYIFMFLYMMTILYSYIVIYIYVYICIYIHASHILRCVCVGE